MPLHILKGMSIFNALMRKDNPAENLTVKRYIKQHPEVTAFWLQMGRAICRYDIKKDFQKWKAHRNDKIVRVEYLPGEPVVLHIKSFREKKG